MSSGTTQEKASGVGGKAVRQGLWLGMFKGFGQFFSWAVTIYVARILVPEDYGLMELATILTGYIMIFNELGLGAAIIQKEEITEEELSSTFWFMVFVGAALAVVAFCLAYPTAWIFKDPRLIPLTQAASALFIIGSMLVVPYRRLDRELNFKKVGTIEFLAVFIACCAMAAFATLGFGVWTLIGGHIVKQTSQVVLTFTLVNWRPKFHYRFSEVRPLLNFGLKVAGSRSLYYVYHKSDRFFAGRILGADALGFYAFALQLASIPTDKIVSIIQQVSFPVFSRTQSNLKEFTRSYLQTVKLIALVVGPIFLAGALLAEEFIPLLLGEKWIRIIYPFKLLCLAQIIVSLNVVNNLANNAQGRPHWVLRFNIISAFLLPLSFYVACQQGFHALPLPWISVYPVTIVAWTLVTLRKIGIPLSAYLTNVARPAVCCLLMAGAIYGAGMALNALGLSSGAPLYPLAAKIVVGALVYLGSVLVLERKSIAEFRKLLRKE